MTSAAGGFGPLQFSADALHERDRAAAFRELYGRKMLRLEIEALAAPFHADVKLRILPGLAMACVKASPVRVGRTRQLIADGNDDLVLQISAAAGIATELGREVAVDVGDAVLLSNADTGTFTLPSASESQALSLPRKALEHLVRDLDAVLVRRVPANTPALRLLTGYIGVFDNALTPELVHLAVEHVYDLVAVALGATRDAAETANSRGVGAARLHAIKADVVAHLGERGLSLDAVADRHGISPVYVRKLFEHDDTSFTQFLLEQRLACAHRMLADPNFFERAIGAVAMDAGFGDLSYFNRAFRRRYGASPSDVRAAARRHGED